MSDLQVSPKKSIPVALPPLAAPKPKPSMFRSFAVSGLVGCVAAAVTYGYFNSIMQSSHDNTSLATLHLKQSFVPLPTPPIPDRFEPPSALKVNLFSPPPPPVKEHTEVLHERILHRMRDAWNEGVTEVYAAAVSLTHEFQTRRIQSAEEAVRRQLEEQGYSLVKLVERK